VAIIAATVAVLFLLSIYFTADETVLAGFYVWAAAIELLLLGSTVRFFFAPQFGRAEQKLSPMHRISQP